MLAGINKKLLPLKMHYFFKQGGIAFFPFLPALVRQRGVSTGGVGLIWTVSPLASLTSSMVVGTVADTFRIHRALFLAGVSVLTASVITFFLLPGVPKAPGAEAEVTLSLRCPYSNRTLVMCQNASAGRGGFDFTSLKEKNPDHTLGGDDEEAKARCTLQCSISQRRDSTRAAALAGERLGFVSNLTLDLSPDTSPYSVDDGGEGNCTLITNINSSSVSQTSNITCGTEYDASCVSECHMHDGSGWNEVSLGELTVSVEFWLMFLFCLFMYGGASATDAMADTVCFFLLEEDRHKYGHQRVWGNIAWGIVGVVSGALVDLFSVGRSHVNFTPVLVLCSAFLFSGLLVSSRIKFRLPTKEKRKAKHIGKLLCSTPMVIFLSTVVVVGAVTGVTWTYLFIVAEDVALAWDPGFPHVKLLQGLMVASTTFLGEVPFMVLSAWIIKKLGSIITFAMSLMVFSLRYFLISWVTNPWFFLPITLLHGLSFGVFFPNMTTYASLMAPKGCQATLQGILKATFTAGLSVGGMVGGLLFQVAGGSKTFQYMSHFITGYTLFFVTVQLLIHQQDPKDRPAADVEGYPATGKTDSDLAPQLCHTEEQQQTTANL
ncbi:major facilitator superfamily domain-containing protein 6-like isoform X1 [Panulirus ornatus]|uniref:major facilitator superfamily domain-containing protein 6-like isoform X1 n=1 Tax=Panulirus ornatus TaxID=150431 RepID=UPI003A877E02